jgi:hypothetical protein
MLRNVLVSALAVLIAADLAHPVAAEEAAKDLCSDVATHYQKLMAGPDAPKAFYSESPLSELAAKPGSGIRLAPHVAEAGKSLSPLQWAQQQKLTLRRQLKDDLDRTDFLDQLPGSSYYAASRVEGTLSCYASTFFTVTNGLAARTREPPNWSEEDGDSCGTYRVFGQIGTTPVAFEERYDDSALLVSTLSVSRWMGDHFAPPCVITFTYEPRFAADQRFNQWQESCTAKNCGALRQAALALAEKLQADPGGAETALLRQLTDQQRATYEAMKTEANVKSPEKPDDPQYFDEKSPATLPLLLDGRLYLAEIGHQTIGWHTFSDWDVKLLAGSGKELARVAQIAIGMTKGRLENVDVK